MSPEYQKCKAIENPKVAAASPAEVPSPVAGVSQDPGVASSAAAPDAAGQPAEYSQEGVAAGEKSEGPAPSSASSCAAEEDQEAAFVPEFEGPAREDMGSEFVRALDGEYTEAAQEEARSAHAAADARWDSLPTYLRLAAGEAPPPDTDQADSSI